MKLQSAFNKVVSTIENSNAAAKAGERLSKFSQKISQNSHGEIVDILLVSGKVATEVSRTLFSALTESLVKIIKK